MPKLPSLRKSPGKPEAAAEAPQQVPDEQEPVGGGMNFSIKMMMMLTLVVAVASAVWGGMSRGGSDRAFYVLFATAAPLLVLLVVGLVHQLTRRR